MILYNSYNILFTIYHVKMENYTRFQSPKKHRNGLNVGLSNRQGPRATAAHAQRVVAAEGRRHYGHPVPALQGFLQVYTRRRVRERMRFHGTFKVTLFIKVFFIEAKTSLAR